jgi:hypothetical protein
MYKRNIEARSRNHCCRGKAGIITHSLCVSAALVIRNTEGMRRYYIIIVLSHKRQDFRGKN